MKTQMRFQKYICLVMLLIGALALLYAFFYASGALSELGYAYSNEFTAENLLNEYDYTLGEGKYDASLYADIQGFNTALMICGIVMILLAVLLYVTACNKRRNYYITNYIATGACAGGNIVISLVLMILNGIWRSRFLNIDFEAWQYFNEQGNKYGASDAFSHYSESTAWFDIGFVVYILVILASVLLILNLVWKIKLMQGEKNLLNGAGTVEGGVAV